MLNVYKKAIGPYATNTYILRDTESGKSAIIDPPVYTRELLDFVEQSGVEKFTYIILTHGHFDHICGVAPLKDSHGGEILIHNKDRRCLDVPEYSLVNAATGFSQIPCTPDKTLEDGDEIILGETKIKVMFTPGHTRGSVIYITDGCIFSGDTLFKLSMGRTDLPGGSTKELFSSLRRIGQISGEYKIFPGHGEETDLTFEKINNRYLRANGTLHT